MEKSEQPRKPEKPKTLQEFVRPVLALEMNDVSDLHAVLRGYYLRQIKSLKKRNDRKMARQLLERHLILPKSRQRTSKDAAYIKEVLGIESDLLVKLEDSRLIRRIHKTGTNPIYEVSHDTLVEPILAERSNREAIIRFIKKTWKYAALFLLLWFYFGMWVQNAVEFLPDPPHKPIVADTILMPKTVNYDRGISLLRLPPLLIPSGLEATDTLNIEVPIQFTSLPVVRRNGNRASDTIAINLQSPIDVSMDTSSRTVVYQSFSDIVVPVAYRSGDLSDPDANRIYARLSGNLRITKDDEAIRSGPGGTNERQVWQSPDSYGPSGLIRPLNINLGDTLIRARTSTRSVPVSFALRLTDLFEDELDKENIRKSVGDRPVRLNYLVQVRPAPTAPLPAQPEIPEVRGIEVQYSDGTSRFIPGGTPAGTSGIPIIHTVATGETLYSIAKKYGITGIDGKISVETIKELNGLPGNAISVGQQLRIPSG